MGKKRVEFLQPVNITEVWSKEDKDFTPWIAQREVLAQVFDECEIDVGTDFQIETEVAIPGIKRKLDVLISAESGERIAIENQFSSLDHDHLTRGLMYAVGLKAKTIIVIAEAHRPEFLALADYLNAAAKAFNEEGISLFLIQIELKTLPGTDVYHPQFTVVARPDEWKAAIFQATHNGEDVSKREVAIFNFHERLLPLLREKAKIFRNVAASTGSWKAGSFGLASIQVKYDVKQDTVSVQLWLHRSKHEENRAGYEYLRAHEEELSVVLGGRHIEWRLLNTAVLETVLTGIGWGVAQADTKDAELVDVVSRITNFARDHRENLRKAIVSNESP
jgi:hypothetical protein